MEFNGQGNNFDPARSALKNGAETKNGFAGNKAAREFNSDPDNYASGKRGGKGVMLALSATLVATLLFGGGAFSGDKSSPDVDIIATRVGANEVSYSIVLPEGEELLLAVFNNNTRLETRLYGGENEGVLTGLNADRTYSLEVQSLDGGETYAKKTIRTKAK